MNTDYSSVMKNRYLFLCLIPVLLGGAPQAVAAQTSPETVEDVVVTARRIEGPMWEMRRGDAVLILVGAVEGLPRDLDWRTETLDAAVARADHVLFPMEGRASLADVGRVLWRARTLTRLPDGRTSADYLSPELEARLEAVRAEGATRQSMLLLSADLLERAGYDRRGRTVSDVVKKATRANRTPAAPVGLVRVDEVIDRLLTTPPEHYGSCMEAAVTAAEAGPEVGRRRAEDWRLRRVQAVLASPLDVATERCGLWSVMGGDAQLRRVWSEAIDAALDQDGVTLAIAPLRLLAEAGGVLDRLSAQGLEPQGPEWEPNRRAPAETTD